MTYRDDEAALEARIKTLEAELADKREAAAALQARLRELEPRGEDADQDDVEPTPTSSELARDKGQALLLITATVFLPVVLVALGTCL